MIFTIDDVLFDEENHAYSAKGKKLHGVTKAIGNYLGMKYPEFLPGCQHGSFVHKVVQMALDQGRNSSDPEAKWVLHELVCRYGIQDVLHSSMSEWLVSDLKESASCIDIAMRVKNNTYDLIDIKTGVVHLDYCALQLGCYKYMLKVSRGFDTGECFILGTKNKAVIPVFPSPEDLCRKILES